jgi:hypothetical protein
MKFTYDNYVGAFGSSMSVGGPCRVFQCIFAVCAVASNAALLVTPPSFPMLWSERDFGAGFPAFAVCDRQMLHFW